LNADLPEPLAAYFSAKNRHDVEAMVAPFAEEAHVRDEGATHKGRAAIRAWIEETTRRYAVQVAPIAVAHEAGRIVVQANVAGNFPASPLTLTYRFLIADDRISALEIGV
jgi:hypothetical protein